MIPTDKNRRFLVLQGPHGPFFSRLGAMLRVSGAKVWRVSFNAGDAAFWFDRHTLIPFTGAHEDWAKTCAQICRDKDITDIILYGDTRPVHAQALKYAGVHGITTHIFEEGYLRPYWVTYERGGTNGYSRLVDLSVQDMTDALNYCETELRETPSHWGDMRHHIFYGALYHWFVMFANHKYRNFRPHRALPVSEEFRLYLRRFLLTPYHALDRWLSTYRVKRGGFPYHLVLLQLEHDTNFQVHSPFASMSEFVKLTIDDFVEGAPYHHHLVFKAHPLESGRVPLRKEIFDYARTRGVKDRVHYIRGGKLAHLLNDANSAITVNSTAAQQALWRGLPLKVFGTSVYSKPEFASAQPLADFFEAPSRPNNAAYRDYRAFLLETSQVTGGYYSSKGRRRLLRHITDMVLSEDDPYDAFKASRAATGQQLRVVK